MEDSCTIINFFYFFHFSKNGKVKFDENLQISTQLNMHKIGKVLGRTAKLVSLKI